MVRFQVAAIDAAIKYVEEFQIMRGRRFNNFNHDAWRCAPNGLLRYFLWCENMGVALTAMRPAFFCENKSW
jgi:hypothetical protein